MCYIHHTNVLPEIIAGLEAGHINTTCKSAGGFTVRHLTNGDFKVVPFGVSVPVGSIEVARGNAATSDSTVLNEAGENLIVLF